MAWMSKLNLSYIGSPVVNNSRFHEKGVAFLEIVRLVRAKIYGRFKEDMELVLVGGLPHECMVRVRGRI